MKTVLTPCGSLSTSPITSPTTLTYPPTSPRPSLRSPRTLLPQRRRRKPSLSTTTIVDPVIGQVTAQGKFICLDPSCHDLTFGRHADFRRHWDNVHAPKKIEYFCMYDGCHRSKKPSRGGKGRSFGAREDKMREHVKTVHGKKRKRSELEQGGDMKDADEDEDENEGEESEEKISKKVRSRDVYDGSATWAEESGY